MNLLSTLKKILESLFFKSLYISLAINLLALTPAVYMLEVYDRVINSQSVSTLFYLLLCAIGCYVLLEFLERIRGRLLQQAGWLVDIELQDSIHNTAYKVSLIHGIGSVQPINDLRTIREGIASPAMIALLDLPSSLLFLVIVTIISPWLGLVSLIGAALYVFIGSLSQAKTMKLLSQANQGAIQAQNYADASFRNAQVINAMGMMPNIYERWRQRQRKFLELQSVASDIAGTNAANSKFIQTMQGSLLLGLSCWLGLKGMLLGGAGLMIVASIVGGKVLSPMVQVVASWRLFINFKDAFQRLENFLKMADTDKEKMQLPAPKGRVSVEGLIVVAPGSEVPIVKGISFELLPGDSIAIIGPSASGKSSLARALMGIWSPARGKVRLDGADLSNWDKELLGPHLGYLPQSIELFDGTVLENITRFGDVDEDQVIQALAQVGLNNFILGLPEGLNTRVGYDGMFLSGGQRQRVGIARAIYAGPSFVVLDEPNSNLDEAGEKLLLNVLITLKTRGCTTVTITQRSGVLAAVDKILVMQDGQVAAFGPRNEVLQALSRAGTAN